MLQIPPAIASSVPVQRRRSATINRFYGKSRLTKQFRKINSMMIRILAVIYQVTAGPVIADIGLITTAARGQNGMVYFDAAPPLSGALARAL
jgi:hypothetical protein